MFRKLAFLCGIACITIGQASQEQCEDVIKCETVDPLALKELKDHCKSFASGSPSFSACSKGFKIGQIIACEMRCQREPENADKKKEDKSKEGLYSSSVIAAREATCRPEASGDACRDGFDYGVAFYDVVEKAQAARSAGGGLFSMLFAVVKYAFVIFGLTLAWVSLAKGKHQPTEKYRAETEVRLRWMWAKTRKHIEPIAKSLLSASQSSNASGLPGRLAPVGNFNISSKEFGGSVMIVNNNFPSGISNEIGRMFTEMFLQCKKESGGGNLHVLTRNMALNNQPMSQVHSTSINTSDDFSNKALIEDCTGELVVQFVDLFGQEGIYDLPKDVYARAIKFLTTTATSKLLAANKVSAEYSTLMQPNFIITVGQTSMGQHAVHIVFHAFLGDGRKIAPAGTAGMNWRVISISPNLLTGDGTRTEDYLVKYAIKQTNRTHMQMVMSQSLGELQQAVSEGSWKEYLEAEVGEAQT